MKKEEKERLILLLNHSCNDFESLEKIMSQKDIIIYNKRLTEKELTNAKGMVIIQALDKKTEEEINILCKNENGILKKFEIQ